MKTIRYVFEFLMLSFFFYGFKLMPVDCASGIGGWIGRTIGVRLATSRKALRNLEYAMPELSENERKDIIRGMWDNLGRVVAEYSHLNYISKHRTTFKNPEILETLIKNDAPTLLIGGHLANWEVAVAATYLQYQAKVHITYRPPNNPWVDKMLTKVRTLNGTIPAYPKSKSGGVQILRALKKNALVGILIDQKYNQGLHANFFGHDAMTNPAFVQFAQRLDCPAIPIQYIRTQGANFELVFHPEISTKDENGTPLPIENILQEANDILETWVRAHPAQWLWLHRRWKF